MTSLRTLSSTSTSIMRSSLLPRFTLNHTQIRTVLALSAFEKVLKETRGDRWKETLNAKQKKYVIFKENGREASAKKLQELHGDKWEAVAAEEAATYYATEKFQDKYQTLKQKLSHKE
ncbi:hypothetical protein VMCG_09507 [Cytospora schulzeri]|uniref:Uncharacterized protein n=1 Tax=Cytospora schulzeri TaxID=448051 RepID=A0A423VFY8_9PEZI|nr:hypothetical protein VMCG_09507 [Valsa malicola]